MNRFNVRHGIELFVRLFVRPKANTRQSKCWHQAAAKKKLPKILVREIGPRGRRRVLWTVLFGVASPTDLRKVPAMRIAGFFIPTEPA